MTSIEKIIAALQPETELERRLLNDIDIQKGMLWGKPRSGHPEGTVYVHIREVLDNIDKLDIDKISRERLRIIAYMHDTFKSIEDKRHPRDWSKHHSVLARQFMESWTGDEVVLEIIELHDEVYHIWRLFCLFKKLVLGEQRKAAFLQRIGKNLQLYYLFFKCDTETGDKDLGSLRWFESWEEVVVVSSKQ